MSADILEIGIFSTIHDCGKPQPLQADLHERIVSYLEANRFYFTCQVLDIIEYAHQYENYWVTLTSDGIWVRSRLKGDIVKMKLLASLLVEEYKLVAYDFQKNQYFY